MFGKKKASVDNKLQEKPTPAYLREDYPYKAVGEAITDLDSLEDGVLYEIKCRQCEMSLRSQGQNIKKTYERLKENGCLRCGNKDLVLKKVGMSSAPKQEKKAE